MTLRLRMWGWMLALVLVSAPVSFVPPAVAEERPFTLPDGQVVITVTLKGREIPALLDTGATASLIDLDLAKELGIRSRQTGRTLGASGRKIAYGYTQQIMLDLGAGPIRRSIGTYPAGHVFAPEGVRLLIGMDFLDAMVLSLDFQTMTMDVQPSSTFKASGGEPLTRTRTGWRRHVLPVDVGGARAELLLDTAATGALHLDSGFVAKASTLKALPVSSRPIVGIDGVRDHSAIVLPSVSLGGELFENVRASSGSLALWRGADMDGLVGVELLKRFNWVIDFGGQRIWMTPNANRDLPFR